MFLFRDVMDKGLVDCNDHKAGKVDDILLELRPGRPPVVRAIITGRGAAAPIFPQWMGRLTGWIERHVLCPTEKEPIMVDWEHVTRIDVVVQLDLDRLTDQLTGTEQAIWQRWIKSLPWGER